MSNAAQLGEAFLALLDTTSTIVVFCVRDEQGKIVEFQLDVARIDGKTVSLNREHLFDALRAACSIVTKRCAKCGLDLVVELFAKNYGEPEGWCKICFRQYKKAWKSRKRQPESAPHLFPPPNHPL